MKQDLLDLAYDAINEIFGGEPPKREELIQKYPKLANHGASFITLNKNKQLRGCIGSIIANKPLIDDIISNAKSSAFRDSRFPVLHFKEFKDISISISLLSTPVQMTYADIDDLKSKIKVNIHGVILQLGSKQSTFLPSVWEQLPNFEIFFSHLCQKAGCSDDCLSLKPNIYTYEAEYLQ